MGAWKTCWLCVVVICLAGCTLGDVRYRGRQADLVYERSGDLGRWRLPERRNDYPWKRGTKTFYFLESGMKVEVEENGWRRESVTTGDELREAEARVKELREVAEKK